MFYSSTSDFSSLIFRADYGGGDFVSLMVADLPIGYMADMTLSALSAAASRWFLPV